MSQDDSVTSIRLRRNTTSTPWGFRMQGGNEYGSILFIQKINPKSLSHRQGLRMGDRILAIGSTQTHNLSHEHAKMEIIRAGNELDLLISRSASSGQDQVDSRPVQKSENSQTVEESTEYRGYTNPNVQSRSFKILQESLNYSEANEEGIVLPEGSTPGEGVVRRAYNEGKRRMAELSELNPRNFTSDGESPYRYRVPHVSNEDETRFKGSKSSHAESTAPATSSVVASKMYEGVQSAPRHVPPPNAPDMAHSSVFAPAAAQQQYIQQAQENYHLKQHKQPLMLVNPNFEQQYGHMRRDPQLPSPQQEHVPQQQIHTTQTTTQQAAPRRQRVRHPEAPSQQIESPTGTPIVVTPTQKSAGFIPVTKIVSSVAEELDLKHDDSGSTSKVVESSTKTESTATVTTKQETITNTVAAAESTPAVVTTKQETITETVTVADSTPTEVTTKQETITETVTVADSTPAEVTTKQETVTETVTVADSTPAEVTTKQETITETVTVADSTPAEVTTKQDTITETVTVADSTPAVVTTKEETTTETIAVVDTAPAVATDVPVVQPESQETSQPDVKPSNDVTDGACISKSEAKEEDTTVNKPTAEPVPATEQTKVVLSEATEEVKAEVKESSPSVDVVPAPEVPVETQTAPVDATITAETSAKVEEKTPDTATTEEVAVVVSAESVSKEETVVIGEETKSEAMAQEAAVVDSEAAEATFSISTEAESKPSDDSKSADTQISTTVETETTIQEVEENASITIDTTAETTVVVSDTATTGAADDNAEFTFAIRTETSTEETVNTQTTSEASENTEASFQIAVDDNVTEATVQVESKSENDKDASNKSDKLSKSNNDRNEHVKPVKTKFVDSQGGVSARLAKFAQKK